METAYLTGKVAGLARLGLLSAAGCFAIVGAMASPGVDQDRISIMHSMQRSAVAWSNNDLDGFMHSYEQSPQTIYVTGDKLVRGYEAIRAMYAARFKPAQPMGRLSLTMIEYRPLGRDFGIGLGRYQLARPGGGTPATGMFTLVFHRTLNGWKIVSDHTSS